MPTEQPNEANIFNAARKLESSAERDAYLAEACQGDAALRDRVNKLLSAFDAQSQFLEQPAAEFVATFIQDGEDEYRAQSLQAGLATAFDEDQVIVLGDGNHSVLKMLGQTLKNVPRVSLRDSMEEGADPIVRPKSAEMPDRNSDSRFQLQGEIARGGMGAILKGRDTDLGRDLAIKVLLDVHKNKPEVVQRFIEEAQIGGQLQHPGIAPIYELGQFADKRPFFAMKLVKGETFAKLLAGRTEPGIDRGKFLGIFQQICQTMAYAHSRGVIHRDLKPANIMVGTFGEVQVMDWGLAKVLSSGGIADETMSKRQQQGQSIIQTLRSGVGSDPPGSIGSVGSQTQMGSVMGTPAYMPPEQALGEIDHLDERADVFGLGAILCEILTGKPPYVGGNATQVFRLASRGKLGDCFERLGNCGADADLIALATHCLELEPQDRPRNAGVLADRVTSYLESVESKLRETELAKVDAQVRAEELRRRQKLALSAGATIVASLVIGIAVSTWQAMRADREASRAELAAIQATLQEQRAIATLDELRATAPAFAEQARALAAKEQFNEAIEKLDYAMKLRPDVAEYLVAKGDLLQCQLKISEAAAIYREALRVQPGLARAQASAEICDEVLAAKPNADGKLTRESLAQLHVAMQRQQRPAAELMPVARLLGEERKLLVDYWLARLKDLPVSPERPLKDRLTVREDSRLALDLSGTKVIDLSPLAGAPLAILNLADCRELTDISSLRGIGLIDLDLSATSVTNLSSLSENQSLESLNVSHSPVFDLTPLRTVRLKSLVCAGCSISNLNPIRGMRLEMIDLRETRVSDLSPLVGMPIKSIDLSKAPVLDFSALAQLPLEKCYLQRNRIADLAVLRGKPLKELVIWGCEDARNYAVLSEIKTLELLLLPSTYRDLPPEDYLAIGALRDHPRLRQLGAEIMNRMGYAGTGSKEIFWQDWDREQAFFAALRDNGILFGFRKTPGGKYVVDIRDQPLRDLSILNGMPIIELDLHHCPFVDLTPIHELKLEKLSISSDVLTDLGPLRGMSIDRLFLNCVNLRDLSPLKEVPLRELYLIESKNPADVAVLAEIPTLEKVTVPVHARNVQALRNLPRLKLLGYRLIASVPDSTFTEFWESYDWISRLQEAGFRTQGLRRLNNGLWELNLGGTDVSDLNALHGIPIEHLRLDNTKVTDLSTLSGMPVRYLYLSHTSIVDLGPLRDMPLKELRMFRTQVSDLSPLKGMPLERLDLGYSRVADISVLRGMPLIEAKFNSCIALTDVSALADSKDLRIVTLPPNAKNFEFLRAFSKLERLSFSEDPNNNYRPDKTAAEFWKDYDGQVWLRQLRESGIVIKGVQQSSDGAWQLDLSNSAISDLTVLKGSPISDLNIGATAVTDLTPLRGLTLKKLSLTNLEVTDLNPLKGMPLEYLLLNGTRVKDLEPLRGMPLTSVRLIGCKELTDLSPLADCKELQNIQLPPNAKEIEFLRTFPKLTRIGFRQDAKSTWLADKTAAEFWQEYDGKKNLK